MYRSVARVVFGVVVCICASCSFRHGLEIKSTNFSDIISPQQSLIFTFSDDVVTDSLINRWDTTRYVKFDPAIEGVYKWLSVNELSFTPTTQFAPSTEYHISVTDKVLGLGSEKKSLGSAIQFVAHTPYLNLESCDAAWNKVAERGGAVELWTTLHFTYAVSPRSVGELLHLKINGREVAFAAVDGDVGSDVRVTLQNIGEDVDDGTLHAEISPGLSCQGSTWKNTTPLIAETQITSRKKLDILSCTPEFIEGSGVLKFVTSQPVELQSASWGALNPGVNNVQAEVTDYGFQIKGSYEAGRSYSVLVYKTLHGVLGGTMNEDFLKTVSFGELQPEISFTSKKAMYLTPKSSRNLGLKIIGVPKVKVTIIRIFENNIQTFLRDSRQYYYEDDSEPQDNDETAEVETDYQEYRTRSYGGGYGNFDREESYYKVYGNTVSEREYETKNLPKSGYTSLLNLSLDNVGEFKGVYIIKVQSMDDHYRSAAKLVSVSDIGLIAKQSQNDVYVFCNSIKSAESLSGVTVKFISTNNQTLQTVTTDGNGVAKFENVLRKAKDFSVGMITALSGSDFNYMMFNDTKVETSRFDVGGLQENSSGLQAFVYGDRDAYRPGETVHLNTIVRDAKWNVPPKVPLKMKILSPDGKEYRLIRLNADAEGSAQTDIPLSPSIVTGTYVVEVYSANDVILHSKNISIEEFVPDRIRLNLSAQKQSFEARDTIQARLNAMNYFGPPAANRKYELTFELSRKIFQAKQYKNYTFAMTCKNVKKVFRSEQSGETDRMGNGSTDFVVPEDFNNTGMLSAKVFGTVFDETGRPVNRLLNYDIPTQKVFFGVRLGDSYVAARQSVSIPIIAVDKNGTTVSAQAHVQFVKTTWQTVMQKNEYGSFNYVSQKKSDVVMDRTLNVPAGGTSIAVTPAVSGDYELRVMLPDADNYVARNLWAWYWGSTQSTAFEVKKEGTIEVSLDKPGYTVGDKANILFKTPFAGRLLVSVERNGIMSYQYLNTDQKSAMMSLKVTEDMVPNVYVTATLFKPLDDGSMPLTVAHGVAPLQCDPVNSTIQLTIDAPEHSRSNTKQSIKVHAANAAGAEVTIAVVDEGILAIKRSKTPDPHGYFYQKRALQVQSFDLYPYIFPDLKPGKFANGAGDDAYESRLTPVIAKRFNLVAFWSGVLKTNGSGDASFTIDIPQFSGSLRVMAVAYKGRAFGSKEKNMIVADPLVVSSGLPRFMSPGDTVRMPVTLTNTTPKTMNVSASVSAGAPAKVVGGSSRSLSIAANSEQRVDFAICAEPGIGVAHVEVKVNVNGETITDKTDIAVRPIAPLTKTTGSGSVAAGESKSVSLSASLIPSTMKARLVVSRSLVAEFSKQLDYLISYPYGCVEQTTSTAFPQLYIADLAKSISAGQKLNANYNVQEAISKLQSMQLYNGSLSYWQGGAYESWWGSIYAAHFLIEARHVGFEVNSGILDRLLQYIAKKAHVSDKRTYSYYTEDNNLKSRSVTPQEVTYSLYVLALSGRQDVALMNFYKGATSLLTEDSRYVLACTYLRLGDRASFDKLTPQRVSEYSQTELGGCFSSRIRDEALILSVMVDVDVQNPQVSPMARHLSQQLRSQRFGSTQENAMAMIALGKLARKIGISNATATISVGSKRIELKDADVVISDGLVSQTANISSKGGSVYYYWEVSGVSSTGDVKLEDNFLRVRRSFLDRNGKELSSNTFKQNELIVVRIVLDAVTKTQLDNIVITDMLPAGFEIENSRITEVQDLQWIKNQTKPTSIDYRDDRVNMFTNLSGTQSFYYVVRAVSPGTYKLGPVGADAMYNGEYHSYNGGGVVRVVQ